MEEEKEVVYEIKPKFNLFYESFMPTGSKLRNTVFMIMVFLIIYIIFEISAKSLNFNEYVNLNFDIEDILRKIGILIIGFLIIKFIVHLVIQIWQYKSITYTFYNDHLVYEDSFLNQHKKTLRYADIKEIEIRRTIWDRINGYGIIVIYTNAEKSYSNGLILYATKNPQAVYSKIDEIIHIKTNSEKVNNIVIKEESENNILQSEEDFKNSISNKK